MGSLPQHPGRRLAKSAAIAHRNQRNRRRSAYNSDQGGDGLRTHTRRQNPRNSTRRRTEEAMSRKSRNIFARDGGVDVLVCPGLCVFFTSLALALFAPTT